MNQPVIDAIIINSSKKFLLVKKKDKWIFPWWKQDIETNEWEIDALLRELKEEIDLLRSQVKVGEKYKEFEWITPNSWLHRVVHTYFCEISWSIAPKNEITDAQYMSYEESLTIDCSDITRQIVETLYKDWYL